MKPSKHSPGRLTFSDYDLGFNESKRIHDVYYKQELEKKADMVEILGIILKFGQLTSKYPDKKHLLPGNDTFISISQYEDLAQEISKRIKE